jgi:hypothetical protein
MTFYHSLNMSYKMVTILSGARNEEKGKLRLCWLIYILNRKFLFKSSRWSQSGYLTFYSSFYIFIIINRLFASTWVI